MDGKSQMKNSDIFFSKFCLNIDDGYEYLCKLESYCMIVRLSLLRETI